MNYKRIIIAALLVIIFIIIAFCVEMPIIQKIDSTIYGIFSKFINKSATGIIKVITFLGNNVIVVLVSLTLLILKSTRKEIGIPAVVSVVSSTILMVTIKLLVARERPNILPLIFEKSYSFPSGHAMVNTALYFTIAFFAGRYIKNKKIAIPITIFIYLFPIIIGLTRVYLGVHYISDVFAGIFIGCAVHIVVTELFKRYRNHDL